jgi:23S rRNA pseudouridine2605 synthase
VDGALAAAGQAVSDACKLSLRGEALPPRQPIVFYLLNKPRGVMTTVADGPYKRSAEGGTVMDLVPRSPRVVPVGRLDYDSEGLILMTNDGSFVAAVTSPSYGVGSHPGACGRQPPLSLPG